MKKVYLSLLVIWITVISVLSGCAEGGDGREAGVPFEAWTEAEDVIEWEAEAEAEPETEAGIEEEDGTEPEEYIPKENREPEAEAPTEEIDRDGIYTSKDDVSLYIHTYGELPKNFITKKEAKSLGWPGGSLDEYAKGKCIGGDRFGNYEGELPDKPGREYRECDIDTLHKKSRGPKRLVYSDDGLIYYTGDHYGSFELLYGAGNP